MEKVITVRRSRRTGTTVALIDNRDESFDVGGLPWITLCEDHGNYCEHETRKLAESHAPEPDQWCAGCQGGEA